MSAVTDWTGRPCPKCGYVRTPLDLNPAWQCPRCQVAYNKVVAAGAPARQALALHAGAIAARAGSDHSLASLVAVNLLALGIALALRFSLRDMMLVYWIQSVVIGLSNVARIARLHDYSTEGVKVNGQPVEPTPATKYQAAGFFALHYGIFHAVYLVFILTDRHAGRLAAPWEYFVLAAAFGANHFFSLLHNLKSDAAGKPNLGTLMFMPYVRIFPMHLTIIFGLGMAGGGTVALVLFGLLKTAADCAMHLVEHHLLARGKPLPASLQGSSEP